MEWDTALKTRLSTIDVSCQQRWRFANDNNNANNELFMGLMETLVWFALASFGGCVDDSGPQEEMNGQEWYTATQFTDIAQKLFHTRIVRIISLV